jgi:hypothetical protein
MKSGPHITHVCCNGINMDETGKNTKFRLGVHSVQMEGRSPKTCDSSTRGLLTFSTHLWSFLKPPAHLA